MKKSRMKEKEYQHELRHLHGELVALQEWVKQTRRLENRINDPRKVWKLSDLDLK